MPNLAKRDPTLRTLVAHRDGDRVLVWQAHGVELADEVLAQQTFGGPHWIGSRTTGLRLSLPALLERTAWGAGPGRERTLGVWIPATALDVYLHQGVLDERNDELYGSVRGHRLATRWAQVLVRWDDQVDLAGVATGRQTPRLGLRQEALRRFTEEDVLAVEDWTDTVRDGPDAVAARLPPSTVIEVPEATLQRLTGAM